MLDRAGVVSLKFVSQSIAGKNDFVLEMAFLSGIFGDPLWSRFKAKGSVENQGLRRAPPYWLAPADKQSNINLLVQQERRCATGRLPAAALPCSSETLHT